MFIRFDRKPKYAPQGITPRRLAAAKRALNKEVEKYPLFADQVKNEQLTPEQRIEKFDVELALTIQKWRDCDAENWMEGRNQLRSMSREHQEEALRYWNKGVYPLKPCYFLSFLRRFMREHGYYVPDDPNIIEANILFEMWLEKRKTEQKQEFEQLEMFG